MYLSVNGDKRPPITNEPALCKAFFSIYTDADAVAPVARERMASGVASLYCSSIRQDGLTASKTFGFCNM